MVLRAAGKRRRSKYRVSFYKKLTDSTGHPVDVPQGVVEVHSDRKSRAIRKARLRFAGLKNVAVWSLRADYEKMELVADSEQITKYGPTLSCKSGGVGHIASGGGQ
jgi:hypothetical protein